MTYHPPGWRVIADVVAVWAVVACSGLTAACSAGSFSADPSGGGRTTSVAPEVTAQQLAALNGVLGRRAAALLRRDRAGWQAAVNPDGRSLRVRQGAEFDRITALPLVRWQYRVTGLAPSPAPDGRYLARVELAYRLAGDSRDVRRARKVIVRPQGGSWYLESETPATDADRELWDLAPLNVALGNRSVAVILDGAPSVASSSVSSPVSSPVSSTLAARADTAARAVDAVWGSSWPRTVVVVLPSDLTQMAAILGRTGSRGLDRLAAVTSGPLDRGRTGPDVVVGAADRVVLNPVMWARLTETGRQVVLTHELTHVATRATTSATPPAWLDEGFAGYVGYQGSGLADVEIAADALAEVRAGRMPTELPGDDRFDPAHGDPSPAYAQAWTACDLVVRRVGISGLVAVYRLASSADGGGPGIDAALGQVLGENVGTFVGQWQERLRLLAGAGG
jgi:hypothetical protein